MSGYAVSNSFLLLLSFFASSLTAEGYYSYAVVESCKGCQLNRLPDVKNFIFEDLQHYENVDFKHVQGAPPELVIYNKNEKEIERLKLAQLTQQECNDLLVTKGFKKSSPIKDEI
ncbi:PREDICTED: selenoprotein M-like [Ceratosolen solmsi marchali]|uniref:Selenoprotein M n=1 Tax=Ceratosolen solmsi marchali TaxID=326594 RepID=A0AAJ6YRN0_9HYME|nr:PREDICTED: selenoprotein M-like [Ceratosolen solmsi marchali]